MSAMRGQVVLGIGEILWDCFEDRRLPGGAPANVVFHAARLGGAGVLCSRVGLDPEGAELLEFLQGRGIDVSLVQRDPHFPTGRVTVDTSDPAAPRFTIHEDVAWDVIPLDDELETTAARCAALCVGTLAQRSEDTRETIQRCLELARASLTVYDVNLRPPFFQRDWIEATLDRVRVVKLNDDEVRTLNDLLAVGAGSEVGFARALISDHDVELVCITRGSRGCSLITATEEHDEPGVAVETVDAVGAGDAFTAGMIAGLLAKHDLPRIARSANRLGAAVAGQPGAMPDLGDLYDEIGAPG